MPMSNMAVGGAKPSAVKQHQKANLKPALKKKSKFATVARQTTTNEQMLKKQASSGSLSRHANALVAPQRPAARNIWERTVRF